MTRYKLSEQAQATAAVFEQAPGAAAGEEVELELTPEQERALIAAGWVEPVKEKGGKG